VRYPEFFDQEAYDNYEIIRGVLVFTVHRKKSLSIHGLFYLYNIDILINFLRSMRKLHISLNEDTTTQLDSYISVGMINSKQLSISLNQFTASIKNVITTEYKNE